MSSINLGDCVKIAKLDDDCFELMNDSLGEIGIVTDVDREKDGTYIYEVNGKWWWTKENLQKGYFKWVSDNED